MDVHHIICIGCPMGCPLTVTLTDQKQWTVEGNTCKIGAEYGVKEVTNPTRIVTSTVSVQNGKQRRASLKTQSDIPKGKIQDCMAEIQTLKVMAPVEIGQVLLSNVAGTGVSLVATSRVEKN